MSLMVVESNDLAQLTMFKHGVYFAGEGVVELRSNEAGTKHWAIISDDDGRDDATWELTTEGAVFVRKGVDAEKTANY